MPVHARIHKMAIDIRERLVAVRRELHRFPELAFQEKRTSRKIAHVLADIGLEVRTGVGGTGVVGLLRTRSARKTFAIRADMDALKIREANKAPYRSEHDGVMHACGHDANMAMAIGAASILAGLRSRVGGNVKFIFQPAEESISGARRMIADGALERPRVNAIIALHLRPDLKLGAVGLCAGPAMAAPNHFRLTVKGRGGHGAAPHMTDDPLVPAHAIYEEFQTIRRNVSALAPFVLSVCAFNAGTTFNIIPGQATMQGTLRTMSPRVRDQVMDRMRRIVRGAAQTYGVKCRLAFGESCPAVVNDPTVVDLIKHTAEKLAAPVVTMEPVMTSEDFAFFLEKAPGAMFRLGTQTGRTIRPLHTDTFNFDERVLPTGAALLAACALDYFQGRRKP